MLRPGSSPRGRGKLEPLDDNRDRCRLIPARAGKTSRTSMSSCSAPAHPRAGGENWNHSTTTETAAGSSPRGRGKPVMSTTDSAVTVAHPRAGGENAIRATVRKSQDGSSPRGRGKLDQLRECFENAGLIPARAGKTQARRLTFSLRRAHPRAGGENPVGGAFPDRSGGSSPRGRGKPDPAHHDPARAGLIPARAGKTRPCSSRPRTCRAHPRAGGENDRREVPAPIFLGSSPRGRGKPKAGLDLLLSGRLIPARAGKTIRRSHSTAHRGGSSPRGRGKLSVSQGMTRP